MRDRHVVLSREGERERSGYVHTMTSVSTCMDNEKKKKDVTRGAVAFLAPAHENLRKTAVRKG